MGSRWQPRSRSPFSIHLWDQLTGLASVVSLAESYWRWSLHKSILDIPPRVTPRRIDRLSEAGIVGDVTRKRHHWDSWRDYEPWIRIRFLLNHMQSLLFGVCIIGHSSISIHTGPHHFKRTNTFCFFPGCYGRWLLLHIFQDFQVRKHLDVTNTTWVGHGRIASRKNCVIRFVSKHL